MTLNGKLLEKLDKIEQGLEISETVRYNESIEQILKDAAERKKHKKWYKNPYLLVSVEEIELLKKKIRENEYNKTGEHTLEIRSANYCYFVELFGSIEEPEPQVLIREEIQ